MYLYKQLIAVLFISFLRLAVYAQIKEEFSDGDFVNQPVWISSASVYTINGLGQLQLNATSAGNSYISTPILMPNLNNVEWNFSIRQNYSPSNSNFSKVYLNASSADLNATSINGYYLRMGKDLANDVVEFFRQTGTTNTLIASALTNISTPHNIEIKVKRDETGLWEIFLKTASGQNFGLPETTFLENTHTFSGYFGIENTYTISNSRNVFFDNILVNQPFDLTLPEILVLSVLGVNTIQIDFSEQLKLPINGNYGRFSLENNAVANISKNSNSLLVNFSNNFQPSNALSISGVADLAGNLISPVVLNFLSTTAGSNNYSKASNYRDIVVNEIMADINPLPDDIPAFEYIELFNNTNQTIDLQGDTLIDGNVRRPFLNTTTIAGKSFIVLVNNETARNEIKNSFPNIQVFTLLGLGLTDAGELLTFKNKEGKVIDQVNYKTSWYKDSNKNKGGFSLEQKNPLNPCSGEANWLATIDQKGGTPGSQNSVFDSLSSAPAITSIFTESTTEFKIAFNQPMDTLSFKSASYQLGNGITAFVNNFKQDTLKLIAASKLIVGKPYTLTISGVKNCEGISLSQNQYIVGLARMPAKGEVVINEIMAEPEPSISLPIAEYVELYNNTNDLIDISNFTLKDGLSSSNGKISANTILLPKSYLLLTSESNFSFFSNQINKAKVNGFPSLNKTGDVVALLDPNTNEIDKINYKPDWYKDELKSEGGWSLEKISKSNNCGGKYNWKASSDVKGGTPGEINSTTLQYIDLVKPLVSNVLLKSNNTIVLSFTEAIDELRISNNFSVSISQNTISKIYFANTDADSMYIQLINPLDSGKTYELKVQELYDCVGNKIDYTTRNIGIGRKPKPYEVVINEIMADETPIQQLPEAEFVELFNTTNDQIDLSNFYLFDKTDIPGKFPANVIIKPKNYLILCSSSRVNDFKPYGDTYGISSFPSLNTTGDAIKLVSPSNTIISKIEYTDNWYADENKKEGGWSLEQVDPLNPCGTSNNWRASVDLRGGTPGKINSIYALNPDIEAPKLIQAFATSSDTLILTFNEPIDSLSALNANYAISNNLTADIALVQMQTINLKLSQPLELNQKYSVTVSQLKDCVGNFISTENYKTFVQAQLADSSDIIINEVLFNPRTGGSDFVEIYNRSEKYINLRNWLLANFQNDSIANFQPITEGNFLIAPFQHKVLTDNPTNIKNNYPKAIDSAFIQMKSLPSYNDDQGNVVLLNHLRRIIDFFHYADDYHLKLLEDEEGVSLERVNSNLSTNTPENWASAAQNWGFATPGFLNSQAFGLEISEKPVDINPKVFSPDQDGFLDFTTITFQNTKSGNIANITIYDLEGRIIRKLIRNQSIGTQNFFQWDGLDDLNRKSAVGNYLVLIEIFNLNGESKRYKENVIVAAKF